ncbi:phenylalanine--tRNA ligase subunit beta [Hydrogenobacter thermophilus]|uniref:phenylalanine--tRNA ligase subunit beta n=1 Tax=Hydrogenobacter thermophilus TaxID=940 RepID=UPI0030FC4E2A
MKVPYTWLIELVDVQDISPEDIARELTLKSVETSVQKFDADLDGVVFGKVVEMREHPTKKNLLVCRLDVGGGYHPTVITGDRSLKLGDGVFLALPGAKVGELCITKREFDGVVSEGMLLSAQELGLEPHSEGVLKIWEAIKPGTSAYDLLGFGEYLLELEITPNRGDLLSVRGVAREVCAIFRRNLKKDKEVSFEEFGELDIQIIDRDCKRYRGALIEGVSVKDSPLWLRRRLWQCGVRSINNVVDITNYIMLRDGQPLHAFDADKLNGGIRVRSAKKGERITLLTGAEKTLTEDNLVIADEEKPLAVAGVIGGQESGVSPSSRRILLESAYFEPYRVRRSSKAISTQTDSSYRFERNVDIEGVKRYQDLAIELILEVAGGTLTALRDAYPSPYQPKTIFLSLEKYRRYAGETLNREEASEILTKLGIPNSPMRCGVEVYVPSHRSYDMQRDVDIIEEILRIKGYNSLPSEVLSLPSLTFEGGSITDRVRELLKSRGLLEIISFSFEDLSLYELLDIEKPTISITNPLVKNQAYMRTSLIPSLLRTCLYNQRQHNYDMALFEVGRVYTYQGEEERLGILLTGVRRLYPQEVYTAYDALSLLLDVGRILGLKMESQSSSYSFLHPYVQTDLVSDGEKLGFVGQLSPRIVNTLELKGKVFIGELRLLHIQQKTKLYKPFSKYPPVIRDLSVLVDKGVAVDKLISHTQNLLKEKLEEVKVFSIYTGSELGEGKKSVSFRLVFRSFEGSMSDGEVNGLVNKLISSLEDSFGARLR